jgi:hypothetical protein
MMIQNTKLLNYFPTHSQLGNKIHQTNTHL